MKATSHPALQAALNVRSALTVVTMCLAACDRIAGGPTSGDVPAGQVEVTSITMGLDLDDGYVVDVDGGSSYTLAANGSLTLSDVPAGAREVRLSGIASNCSAPGGASRSLNVTAGQLSRLSYEVWCEARLGIVAISISTTGEQQPSSGYRLGFGSQEIRSVNSNDLVMLEHIHEGSYSVSLQDVPANCTVGGGNPQIVGATYGVTTSIALRVVCVATRGTVRITTSTSGQEVDPDGYTASMEYGASYLAPVPVNGTVTIDVEANRCVVGEYLCGYRVGLTGVATNCTVEARDWWSTYRLAPVEAGATVDVSFAVTCEPSPVKRLAGDTQLAIARADGRIWLMNSDGTAVRPLTAGPSDDRPAWSPDGLRLAFVRANRSAEALPHGSYDIYIVNADGSNEVRRTSAGYNVDPTWSPDGSRIAFSTVSDGSLNIYAINANHDGQNPWAVVHRIGWDAQPAWSPDGRFIAFVSDWSAYDFTSDVFLAAMDGSGEGITQLTRGFAFFPNLVQYYSPAWSPDSRRLAVTRCRQAYYTCDASSLLVLNVDGTVLTSLGTSRGYGPVWSPDGQVIAYSAGGAVFWIAADGSDRGIITNDGYTPAWRPVTPH